MSLPPLTAFHFTVTVHGSPSGPDAAFSSIENLTSERAVEEIREGGENRFMHRLPAAATHRNLVLRRGVMEATSPLRRYAIEAMQWTFETPLEPIDVDVKLLGPEGDIADMWTVYRAYPVHLSLGALDATANRLAVETIELAYSRIARDDMISTATTRGLLFGGLS